MLFFPESFTPTRCFLKVREISENINLAQEVIKGIGKKKIRGGKCGL